MILLFSLIVQDGFNSWVGFAGSGLLFKLFCLEFLICLPFPVQSLWLTWLRPCYDYSEPCQVCFWLSLDLNFSSCLISFIFHPSALSSCGLFPVNSLVLAMGIALGAAFQVFLSILLCFYPCIPSFFPLCLSVLWIVSGIYCWQIHPCFCFRSVRSVLDEVCVVFFFFVFSCLRFPSLVLFSSCAASSS